MTDYAALAEECKCGHPESDHRSIPPYHCQNGMAEMKPLCKCPVFIEEDGARLDAEYEMQKYEDMRSQYD